MDTRKVPQAPVTGASAGKPLRLAVLAHVPPPFHGQSVMVQTVLDACGGALYRPHRPGEPPRTIEAYHINFQLSDELADVGSARVGKLLRLMRFATAAVWLRFRCRAVHLYYIPGPPVRAAIVRDWLAMALCRPFFHSVTYHWQAGGLGEWVEERARGWERGLTRWLLGRPDLSLILGRSYRRDAEALQSRRVVVLPNAVADPVPDYETGLRPAQKARRLRRMAILAGSGAGTPEICRVLFLSMCHPEKGLFDLLEAARMLNQSLAEEGRALRLQVVVAGKFYRAEDEAAFARWLDDPPAYFDGPTLVKPLGFVAGAEKDRAFREADLFCLPTWYTAENAPLAVAEAMAYGLPVVTTRWRAIPDMLPEDHPLYVPARAPADLMRVLRTALTSDIGASLRRHFLGHLELAAFSRRLRESLELVRESGPDQGESDFARPDRGSGTSRCGPTGGS